MAQARRPAVRHDSSRSPAPETVEVDARERDVEVEVDEVSTRVKQRVRQIAGGDVHWFNGGALARETR